MFLYGVIIDDICMWTVNKESRIQQLKLMTLEEENKFFHVVHAWS